MLDTECREPSKKTVSRPGNRFSWSLNLKYLHQTTRNIFGSQHLMVLGRWMAVASLQRFLSMRFTELFDLVQWSTKNGSSFTVTLYTLYRNKKGAAWQVIWQCRNNNIWRNNTIAASWSSVGNNLHAVRMNIFMSATPVQRPLFPFRRNSKRIYEISFYSFNWYSY